MKTIIKKISMMSMLLIALMAFSVPAYAAELDTAGSKEAGIEAGTEAGIKAGIEAAKGSALEEDDAADATGNKAFAAALCVGMAAAVGAISMGWAISKSSESISRQPEAGEKIRTSLMLGLVFIETAIIYALIVAILIIFVL